MTSSEGGHGAGWIHYVIFSEPTDKEGRAGFLKDHLAYVAGLESRGIVFAAGPMLDEAGEKTGTGMIVVRAGNLAEAEAIAREDPFHKLGYRSFRVQPWMINEGGFTLGVTFSDGGYRLS